MMSASHTPEETKAALHEVVTEMYDKIVKGEPPTMTLPVRTKNNIGFDKNLGVYKYGKKRSVRDATSLGSAKQLLRALHVVEFIEEMINTNKSSTLREMYYISESWGLGKFSSQNESNNLAEDLEVVTQCLREDFKLRPEEDGARMIGNVTIRERNRRGEWMRINARDDVGDSGYGVPYNVEEEKIELLEHEVNFIMAIETGGMFDRLIENGFDEDYNCALVHLKGQPARSTRRILKRMSEEWDLPVWCSSTATRGRSGSLPPLPTAPSKRRTFPNTWPHRPPPTSASRPTTLKPTTCPATTCHRGTLTPSKRNSPTRGSPTDGGKIRST